MTSPGEEIKPYSTEKFDAGHERAFSLDQYRRRRLEDLLPWEVKKLKEIGMFHEFYPEANE